MKSYASVEEIEGKYIVCEVELLDITQSRTEDFASKKTTITEILLQEVTSTLETVNEGDILIVEHEDGNIIYIYCKDEAEKQRRVEIIKQLQI